MTSNAQIRTVAVIGAGPSGLSAVKALDEEKTFDSIRVFERRDRVGGTWYVDSHCWLFSMTTRVDYNQAIR